MRAKRMALTAAFGAAALAFGAAPAAQVQTKFDQTYHATGCDDRNSGNSNRDHAYGTELSGADKRRCWSV